MRKLTTILAMSALLIALTDATMATELPVETNTNVSGSPALLAPNGATDSAARVLPLTHYQSGNGDTGNPDDPTPECTWCAQGARIVQNLFAAVRNMTNDIFDSF